MCRFADRRCRWADRGTRSLRALAPRLLWSGEGATLFRADDDARRVFECDDGQHVALFEFQDGRHACPQHAHNHSWTVDWNADFSLLAIRTPRNRDRLHPARFALAYFLAPR